MLHSSQSAPSPARSDRQSLNIPVLPFRWPRPPERPELTRPCFGVFSFPRGQQPLAARCPCCDAWCPGSAPGATPRCGASSGASSARDRERRVLEARARARLAELCAVGAARIRWQVIVGAWHRGHLAAIPARCFAVAATGQTGGTGVEWGATNCSTVELE